MINATRYRLDAEVNRQAALAKQIAHLQAQISTGKRIQTPSDDPIASARLAEIGETQSDQAAWARNLSTASHLAADGYTALQSLATAMNRALTEVLAAKSGSASDETRTIAATVLNDVADQIGSLSNTRDLRGEPLFRTNGLDIPVGPGVRISPVAEQSAVFGPITVPSGSMSLADIATAAANAALEPDPTLRAAALAAALDDINAAVSHVALAQGDQNLRGERIAGVEEALTAQQLDLAVEREGLEKTDEIETISKLKALELSLEAAQAVFANISQKSLFDYLR